MGTVEGKLRELGIHLPTPAAPVANSPVTGTAAP